MAWDAYVSQNLMCPVDAEGHTLTAAAILGHDGGVWAQSEHFPALSEEELATLVRAFDELSVSSFLLAGRKYLRVVGSENILRGKRVRAEGDEEKPGGCTIMKTNSALVVGLYNEPVQPGTCNKVVETLGDYLIENGY